MVQRDKHDITNPLVAVRLFRYWCGTKGIIPEYATMRDLDQFGYYLMEDGYAPDEVRSCEHVVFSHL